MHQAGQQQNHAQNAGTGLWHAVLGSLEQQRSQCSHFWQLASDSMTTLMCMYESYPDRACHV